jgi:hypothetical protein
MSNVSGAPHHTLGSSAACSLMWHESSDSSSAPSLTLRISGNHLATKVQAFSRVELQPTMPSADFCESITKPLDPASTRQIHRPPGVRRVTFLSHTRRIYDGSVPDDIGLCIFVSAYPPATASDAVRVTRAKSLPAPSFRQYLAIPPLVFG